MATTPFDRLKVMEDYRRERKRVQAIRRRLEKEGYIFLDGLAPPKPKRVTAGSVRRLAAITPDVARKRADLVVEPDTGEVLKKRKKPAKRPKAKKPAPSAQEKQVTNPPPVLTNVEEAVNLPDDTGAPLWEDIVISQLQDLFNRHPIRRVAQLFDAFMWAHVNQDGKYKTAYAFAEAQKHGYDIGEIIANSDVERFYQFVDNFDRYFPSDEHMEAIQSELANYDEIDDLDISTML